ncbi:MAG: hypothetical protein HYU02_08615 [Thaumarchaeota archaeon]|nr:hypothetical protein [Nitrososphaerota archaeon]
MAIEDELELVRQYIRGEEFAAVAEICRKYEIPGWSLRRAIESLAEQPDLRIKRLEPHEPMNTDLNAPSSPRLFERTWSKDRA